MLGEVDLFYYTELIFMLISIFTIILVDAVPLHFLLTMTIMVLKLRMAY